MQRADVFAFNDRLRALTTPAACAALFRQEIAPHGFDTFACGDIDLRDRDRAVFFIIDWPDDWRRFYAESGMLERDPLLDALATRREPFTWSDLRADRKLAKVGREALDRIAVKGWHEGLVVPMPHSGSRMGLVSLVGHATIDDPNLRAFLTLISSCLHTHVRALVPREGFAIPPLGLTEREIASLRLVARGLSDAAIGAALGVAQSTAHEFVEKAKQRLKVRSRAELVAVATSLAIIDI